ncbi:transcription termination factor Rho [Streptomyces sp. WAC 06738]|uniref:transcription termination factor Rho n=1 Tax=Streptomyces sp. WAC 06738 TaxID=2203210 RepID=UPI000F6C5723|nr:transcription termination factor Rho [Streptomyces sp. WAC 06738]AZM47372.1 transcription termination factor Rho [Streptomyces sp. WAC 06738]
MFEPVGNHGFLRVGNLQPGDDDVQVPANLIRRFGLRKGDLVEGGVLPAGGQAPKSGSGPGPGSASGSGKRRERDRGAAADRRAKVPALARVDRVAGLDPEAAARRPRFADLVPLHPTERLRLETSAGRLTNRVVDLLAPVGKGQRGLIVAPPKTGKTILLQHLADAIAVNHPECHLMVVLLDERPEEVTDMQRSVRAEVISSTFDRPAREHVAVAEMAIERAKRMVEGGQDVVILLDSLTRLCRAANNSAGAGGRTLTGGVDASALLIPKKLFGAARNIEDGGSLTILASALVETGSRGDDYYFEELKSTGNMELRLSRTLAERRIFPAVDVHASGTRREELLAAPGEVALLHRLRRVLGDRDAVQSMELLLERMKASGGNAEFLLHLARTTPA